MAARQLVRVAARRLARGGFTTRFTRTVFVFGLPAIDHGGVTAVRVACPAVGDPSDPAGTAA